MNAIEEVYGTGLFDADPRTGEAIPRPGIQRELLADETESISLRLGNAMRYGIFVKLPEQ